MQILAHENGEHVSAQGAQGLINNEKWVEWIGNFHPILLHFPIALVVMTAVAEILAQKSKSSIFSQAARFMIIAAAITATPTALLGWAFSYSMTYEGLSIAFFWWHRFLGIATAVLAIFTAILKELEVRGKMRKKFYVISLILLLICTTATGFLGGELSFNPFHLLPNE